VRLVSEAAAQPQRSDARRNRAALVVAAGELLAEHGLAVQIEDVAAEAGVGVATIYRHFGSRVGLIREVLAGRTIALVDRVEAVAAAAVDPGDALRQVVRLIVGVLANERGLVDVAMRLRAAGDEPDPSFAALMAAIGRVLGAAQDTGAARRDIELDDLDALLIGIGMAATSAGSRDRLCEVVLDGLQFGPDHH
jgi:AcrR family transcriptional regulator